MVELAPPISTTSMTPSTPPAVRVTTTSTTATTATTPANVSGLSHRTPFNNQTSVGSSSPSSDTPLTAKEKLMHYATTAKAHLLHSPLPDNIPTFSVDLVLVYNPAAAIKNHQLPPNIRKLWKSNPEAERSSREGQFGALVRDLKRAGLKITCRKANEGAGQSKNESKPEDAGKIWIFVSADDELLVRLKQKER